MMDCARKTPKIFSKWRDRSKISIPKTGDAEEEKKSLLPSAMAGKKKARNNNNNNNNQKRRVQWNDDHGDKLAQVLEFLPSDSSDSEDEYIDSCICTIM